MDAVERQVGMVITGGRVEYGQTLWKMVGDGIIKYTQSGDWSSKFEMIHTCTCEVDKVKSTLTKTANIAETGISLPHGRR